MMRLLLLLMALTSGRARVTVGFDDPIAANHDVILTAAQQALRVYSSEAPPDGDTLLEDVTFNDGAAALFHQTDDYCFITFRGSSNGFSWVSNIDMRLAHIRNAAKPSRKCRVVRHYHTLYKGVSYWSDLYTLLRDNCVDRGTVVKPLVFAGHDLGGALATLAAVEFFPLRPNVEPSVWAVTFGQPPVFMPASYRYPEGLSRDARRKHPCKFINPNTYVPFHNAEFPSFDTDFFYYDFMIFLNVMLFAIAQGDPRVTATCLIEGGDSTKAFIADPTVYGNLGYQFGQRYLFPGRRSFTPNQISYVQFPTPYKFVDFGDQVGPGVTLDMLLDSELTQLSETLPPPLPRPDIGDGGRSLQEPTGIDCSEFPFIHKMETYLSKLEALGSPPVFFAGFDENDYCNVNTDCQSGDCWNGHFCVPEPVTVMPVGMGNNEAMMK